MEKDEKLNQSIDKQKKPDIEVNLPLNQPLPQNENPRSSVGVDEESPTEFEKSRARQPRKRETLSADKRVPNYIEGYEQEE